MISARNKKQPSYGDYLSFKTLSAMYVSIRSMSSANDRVFFTTLHLICEICLKKMSIYYGEEVSLTNHWLGGMLYKLSEKDVAVKSVVEDLTNRKLISYFQRYPYDELRFKENVVIPPIPYNVMFQVTECLLARVGYIEGVGF